MARVQHPTFPAVFEDVPDESLAGWLAAGWLDCPTEVDGQTPPVERSRRGTK